MNLSEVTVKSIADARDEDLVNVTTACLTALANRARRLYEQESVHPSLSPDTMDSRLKHYKGRVGALRELREAFETEMTREPEGGM